MSPFNPWHRAGRGGYSIATLQMGKLSPGDGVICSRPQKQYIVGLPLTPAKSSFQGLLFLLVPDFPNRAPPTFICEVSGLRAFSDPRLRKRGAARFSGCSESSSGGRWSLETFLATSNSCGDVSPGPLWVNRWLKIAQRCGCVCAGTG